MEGDPRTWTTAAAAPVEAAANPQAQEKRGAEAETRRSEEDRLLDPLARSIVRDLRAEAVAAAGSAPSQELQGSNIFRRLDINDKIAHIIQSHLSPDPNDEGVVVVTLNDGSIIRCDEARREELSLNQLIHCNMKVEVDGNDAWGLQGGQLWRPPTAAPQPPTGSPSRQALPTASPSTTPTGAPSFHPTIHGDPFELTGTVYFDANLNGKRDSDVDYFPGLGRDAEHRYGLGGVSVSLLECDAASNQHKAEKDREEAKGGNSYAVTLSQGYDVHMRPVLAGHEDEGGVYNLIDVKVGRSYYIQATAPEGYLFSGGVCNDEYVGWECEYSSAEKFAQGHNSRRRLRVGSGPSRDMAEATLGIPEGRSQKCVTIDPQGIADRRIDLGVIRVQDARLAVHAETGVELALSVDAETEFNMDASDTGPGRRWRSLMEGARIREAPGRKVELGRKEMEAIGEVTAEVLASTVEARLMENGVVMNGVSPIAVTYTAFDTEDGDGADPTSDSNTGTRRTQTEAAPPRQRRGGTGALSIKVSVQGYFNRDLNVDFDYIVQDSINRDSKRVRNRLLTYNDNCRSQTVKVRNKGLSINDFSEIHRTTGVERPRDQISKRQQQQLAGELTNEQAYSASCEQRLVLPEYFETSLGKVELKAKLGIVETKTGVSPLLVSVGVLLFGLFALVTGYFMWQRGKKETEEEDVFEDTQSMKDPTDACTQDLDLSSYEDELRQYKKEMSSKKERCKGGNKFDVFDDSTIPSKFSAMKRDANIPFDDATFGGSVAASYASHDLVPRVVRMGPDGDGTEESNARSSRELFKMTTGAPSDSSVFSGNAPQRSASQRSKPSARTFAQSRNAIPEISSVDYEDSMENTHDSSSSSSSSSSDSDSDSDSS